jgi:hypothetical protein
VQQCYNITLKGALGKTASEVKIEEKENYQSKLGEPVEDMEEFKIGNSKRKIRVESQLSLPLKESLVAFLCDNTDVFAWSHEDMTGIDPSVLTHMLNVDPSH